MALRSSRLFILTLSLPLGACSGHHEFDKEFVPDWQEVELIYPAEGWNVTDYAVSFRWYSQLSIEPDAVYPAARYQIQVDDTANFYPESIRNLDAGFV